MFRSIKSKVHNVSQRPLIITNIRGKSKSGILLKEQKIECYISLTVVGGDGRQSWVIVLDKINNVSRITVLFCDQDVRVVFAWT